MQNIFSTREFSGEERMREEPVGQDRRAGRNGWDGSLLGFQCLVDGDGNDSRCGRRLPRPL